MKRALIIAAILTAGLTSPTAVYADSAPIYTPWSSNVAVGGYDVVSFYSGKPRKGTTKFFYEHEGARWLFVSERSRDTFIGNPERYAPAYGGYCAWALAKGKLAKGSPKHWSLVDGQLFLNFNGRIKKRWDVDRTRFIEKADANWPEVLED